MDAASPPHPSGCPLARTSCIGVRRIRPFEALERFDSVVHDRPQGRLSALCRLNNVAPSSTYK